MSWQGYRPPIPREWWIGTAFVQPVVTGDALGFASPQGIAAGAVVRLASALGTGSPQGLATGVAQADAVLGPALILLASAYALFIWLLFFHNFIDFYLDTWVVTNEPLLPI